MRNNPINDDDYKLWWLLLQTRRALHRNRVMELLQYKITPEEAAVLIIVKAVGHKATAAEISRWTLRAHHTISGLLERMEKRGLILKVNDLARKNSVRIALTKEGEKAYSQAIERENMREVFRCLTQKEFQQLRLLLEKLRNTALDVGGIKKKPVFPKFE